MTRIICVMRSFKFGHNNIYSLGKIISSIWKTKVGKQGSQFYDF